MLVGILEAPTSANVAPTLPSGWGIIPVANNGNAQYVQTANDPQSEGTYYLREWMVGHKYASGDPASFSFTVTLNPFYCVGSDCLYGEPSLFLADYSGSSAPVTGVTAYGYPSSTDATTITAGPINPGNDLEVVGLFAAVRMRTSPGRSTTFGSPSGYPPLSTETPLFFDGAPEPLLLGDLFTAGFTGFNYGAYS